MKIITIEIADVFKDPSINIESDDYPIHYAHLGTEGRTAQLHGLQCSWLENEAPEKYKELLSICDQMQELTRKLIKLHEV